MPSRNPSLLAQEMALVLHNPGVRTGAYAGVALAIGFAAILALLAAVPVLRFLREPGNLLVASLIAWSMLAFAYRAICLHFTALGERYSAMQVFTLGAVVYMILATLSWIGTCLWRLRHSQISHSHHESQISHPNHPI
jgi:hypothetical protein